MQVVVVGSAVAAATALFAGSFAETANAADIESHGPAVAQVLGGVPSPLISLVSAPQSPDTQLSIAQAGSATALGRGAVTPQIRKKRNVGKQPASVNPTPWHTDSGWFTPVRHYHLSSRFGVPGSWASGYHTGLDFGAEFGQPVYAGLSGTIVAASYAGAYGNLIQLKWGRGRQMWYAHNDRMFVKPGDKVRAGQMIGRVGMTGNTTGPHSHFEVRINNNPVNPANYLWPNRKIVAEIG